MAAVHDPGLRAVARVRDVRERDARLGLQHALRDLWARQARLEELEDAVTRHRDFVSGDLNEFVAMRASLMALREAVTEARVAVATATSVAVDAQERWTAAKSRLGAVENVLDWRAAERAVERARLEAKELDDIAAQRWLRGTA